MPYHHYISSFHLAEFTPERRREGRLYVFDVERRRRWRSTAGGVGGEQRYNEVQGVSGVGSEEIERFLSEQYEAPAAPVLRAVNDTETLPAGSELVTLLRYFALLSANNPSRRGAMNDAQEQALRFLAGGLTADSSDFGAIQSELRSAGVPLLGECERDELVQRLEADTFSYKMSSADHLRGLGNLVDAVAGMLIQRTWSLLIARKAPEFVIGDHPVSLEWKAEHKSTFPPGFAMEEAEVLIPVGRKTALLGVFDGASRRLMADAAVVAEANRRILRRSRFVYSAVPEFTYAAGGNIVCSEGRFAST